MPVCVKRKEGEMVQDIETVDQVKFLFSPGAEQTPSMKYGNKSNVAIHACDLFIIMFNHAIILHIIIIKDLR